MVAAWCMSTTSLIKIELESQKPKEEIFLLFDRTVEYAKIKTKTNNQ